MQKKFILDPDVSDITTKPLADFYRLWKTISDHHGGLPLKKHITMRGFKDHLPWIALHAFDQETQKFTVKIFGTGYVDAIGFDPTGNELQSEKLHKKFIQVVETGLPYVSYRNELTWAKKEFRLYDVIGCPLFFENGDVSHVLFRVDFKRRH